MPPLYRPRRMTYRPQGLPPSPCTCLPQCGPSKTTLLACARFDCFGLALRRHRVLPSAPRTAQARSAETRVRRGSQPLGTACGAGQDPVGLPSRPSDCFLAEYAKSILKPPDCIGDVIASWTPVRAPALVPIPIDAFIKQYLTHCRPDTSESLLALVRDIPRNLAPPQIGTVDAKRGEIARGLLISFAPEFETSLKFADSPSAGFERSIGEG